MTLEEILLRRIQFLRAENEKNLRDARLAIFNLTIDNPDANHFGTGLDALQRIRKRCSETHEFIRKVTNG